MEEARRRVSTATMFCWPSVVDHADQGRVDSRGEEFIEGFYVGHSALNVTACAAVLHVKGTRDKVFVPAAADAKSRIKGGEGPSREAAIASEEVKKEGIKLTLQLLLCCPYRIFAFFSDRIRNELLKDEGAVNLEGMHRLGLGREEVRTGGVGETLAEPVGNKPPAELDKGLGEGRVAPVGHSPNANECGRIEGAREARVPRE